MFFLHGLKLLECLYYIKKKTYWPSLPMLNSPLMNKKSSSFYFEPFPFLLGFLVFIFLPLWFFLSFYFFISFFRLSLLLLLCLLISFYLSSTKLHFSLSLMYLFSFLGRSILWLHPLATLTGCDWALLFFVSHPDRISWL